MSRERVMSLDSFTRYQVTSYGSRVRLSTHTSESFTRSQVTARFALPLGPFRTREGQARLGGSFISMSVHTVLVPFHVSLVFQGDLDVVVEDKLVIRAKSSSMSGGPSIQC